MTLAEFLTVVAIISGPIVSILAARYLEHRKEIRGSRLDVFRTLMRTRRNRVHPDHVGALNLVEIEFHRVPKVIQPFKKLMDHLGNAHQRVASEVVTGDMTDEERQRRDTAFDTRLSDERARLLAILLHGIAEELNFKIEQMEIFEGGYTPQGWENLELEQSIIRRYFVDLYRGARVLPIGVVDYRQGAAVHPEEVDQKPPT